jgi:hypothetical protein
MSTLRSWLFGAAIAAVVAVDASAAESATAEPTFAAAATDTSMVEALADEMRELLQSVTPVITLPAIEIALPKLAPQPRSAECQRGTPCRAANAR